MTDQTYSPGFHRPVFDSQAIFRILLNALSRPALMFSPAEINLPHNAPLPPLAAGLALALLDFDTPVWLSPSWSKAAGWLAFHNGVKISSSPGEASFILAASLEELPDLQSLLCGTERYPDRSATIILKSTTLDNYANLYAEGPGLSVPHLLPPSGLQADFVKSWNENHSLYPCGVDLIVLNDGAIWALPRSIKLAVGPERQAA